MSAKIKASTADGSIDLDVVSWATPGGWLGETLRRETEPLTSAGVDGTRLRIPRSDYEMTDVDAIIGASSWADALYRRAAVYLLVGRAVTVSVTTSALTRAWNNVLVHQITECEAVPGPLISIVETPCHVRARIRLQLTKDSVV